MDKKYIGGLYKAVGLGTSNDVIEKQENAAKTIFAHLTFEQSVSLVHILLGENVQNSQLTWLIDAVQDDHPGFGSDGIDHDVEILAAVLVREALGKTKPFSNRLCLLVECASFGNKRKSKIDQDIPVYAMENLVDFQMAHNGLEALAEVDFSDFEEILDDVDAPMKANNLTESWVHLRPALEDIREAIENSSTAHFQKINEMVTTLNSIDEQMQVQWFAVSKWSRTANKAFSGLVIGDALTRASYELAKIVKTAVGPVAAPALLNMALADSLAKPKSKELVFAEVVTAAPIVWRKSWASFDLKSPILKLTPILAAISMASEAGDGADWLIRFNREMAIDTTFKISPLDFALQLFHELLVVQA